MEVTKEAEGDASKAEPDGATPMEETDAPAEKVIDCCPMLQPVTYCYFFSIALLLVATMMMIH